MNNQKFGADLCGPNGTVGGYIYVTDTELIWKPVLTGKGFSFPIDDLIGYIKDGTHIYLQVEGMDEFAIFYTWKGQSIIDAIKDVNPNFRMLASNEYTEDSGCSLVITVLLIATGSLLALL